MSIMLVKAAKILTGRVALNIYWWVLALSLTFTTGIQPVYYLFMAVFTLLLAVPAYINNLYLAPRFLAQKRYAAYLLRVIPLFYFFSFFYTLGLKIMLHDNLDRYYSNVLKVYNDSTTGNLSFISVIADTWPTYFLTFLTLACIFNMAWYVRYSEQQDTLVKEARIKQTESELGFLKNQINPHFLFNTLNNLYALILIKSDNAEEVVPKLSNILRYLLYESNVKEISFEKEKEIMQSYIELELLRLKDINNIHFSISSDKTYNIPPLLWVPVLENVFKHGTRYINDEYFIDFRFVIKDNLLTIFSENNCKAAPDINNNRQVSGIGLDNLRKRLSLLYPGKHRLSLSHDSEYFVIEVKIELE